MSDEDEPANDMAAVEIAQIVADQRGHDMDLPWSTTVAHHLNDRNARYLYFRRCMWCREYVSDRFCTVCSRVVCHYHSLQWQSREVRWTDPTHTAAEYHVTTNIACRQCVETRPDLQRTLRGTPAASPPTWGPAGTYGF
eukprot:5942504-Amphidinium_carterae.1